MTDNRTPLGAAIEAARRASNLSVRAAAARAKISEGRWRQLVKGYQSAGGHQVPAKPREGTVMAMARAVGLDVNEALALAGFDPIDERSLTPPPLEGDPQRLDVVDAIMADHYLLPEAKEHFLNQYLLLLRVHRDDVSKGGDRPAAVTERRSPSLRSLPAVASGGDPEHAEQVAQMAREIRARLDRERDQNGD